jgi:sortase A
MKADSKAFRILEGGLLFLGLLLLAVFAFAHIDRFIMFRAEMAKFEAPQPKSPKGGPAGMETIDGAIHNADLHQGRDTESRSANQHTKLYQANLGKSVEPLAVLRIPALHLEVPVLEGTDEVTLNRGVGRIAGTSFPGEAGNIGIAGHRDGFFRKLKDIHAGDAVELATVSGTDIFVVDRIRITSPADVSVLRPRTKHSITLVTCYPFYFVGPAPRRFIVQASLKELAFDMNRPYKITLDGRRSP